MCDMDAPSKSQSMVSLLCKTIARKCSVSFQLELKKNFTAAHRWIPQCLAIVSRSVSRWRLGISWNPGGPMAEVSHQQV